MARIAFYYSHLNTLGHAARLFFLIKELKSVFKNDLEITVLQGGRSQKIFPFREYARVYTLPFSVGKRLTFTPQTRGFYHRIVSSGQAGIMLKERLKRIKNIINRFKPQVFVSEYFPFGRAFWSFEIPPILKYLKNEFGCKVISSSAYLDGCTADTYRCLKNYYDLILIHFPREYFEDYLGYLDKKKAELAGKILVDFSAKIHFTGFISEGSGNLYRQRINPPPVNRQGKKLILVSRGGGVFGRKLILSSLLLARQRKDLFFVVSCGPATSLAEFNEYKKLSRNIKNLKLFKFLHPSLFERYLKTAAVSINLAGYNTTVKLLGQNKRAVFIPCCTQEQRWRAVLAKRYLRCGVIPEEKLKVSLLDKALNQQLRGKSQPSQMRKGLFSGAADTRAILTRFFRRENLL